MLVMRAVMMSPVAIKVRMCPGSAASASEGWNRPVRLPGGRGPQRLVPLRPAHLQHQRVRMRNLSPALDGGLHDRAQPGLVERDLLQRRRATRVGRREGCALVLAPELLESEGRLGPAATANPPASPRSRPRPGTSRPTWDRPGAI